MRALKWCCVAVTLIFILGLLVLTAPPRSWAGDRGEWFKSPAAGRCGQEVVPARAIQTNHSLWPSAVTALAKSILRRSAWTILDSTVSAVMRSV